MRILLLPLVVFTGCVAGGMGGPPQTVESVSLDRYAGLWFEIARYPQPFEFGCTCVTAEYTLRDNGEVGVRNTCRLGVPFGPPIALDGTATVPNPDEPGKLQVSFFGQPADYWIVGLDDDYQWAVVSDPNRETLWILSRTRELPELEAIKADLAGQGFDLEPLQMTVQEGCPE